MCLEAAYQIYFLLSWPRIVESEALYISLILTGDRNICIKVCLNVSDFAKYKFEEVFLVFSSWRVLPTLWMCSGCAPDMLWVFSELGSYGCNGIFQNPGIATKGGSQDVKIMSRGWKCCSWNAEYCYFFQNWVFCITIHQNIFRNTKYPKQSILSREKYNG